MVKLAKNMKTKLQLVDKDKLYDLAEALEIAKKCATSKFDETLEIAMNLGIDPRHADQAVRGMVDLPAGTGKDIRVAVFAKGDKAEEAKAAGADHVGLDEFIAKIEGGWTDIDVIVATPSVMPKIGKLGKVLGPRNLMPNPKTGTVTNDVAGAVNDLKGGKIAFKVDKVGIIHASIGRVSFAPEKLAENCQEFINAIIKLKPSTSKGTYLKGVSMASTMSPGIMVDTKSVQN